MKTPAGTLFTPVTLKRSDLIDGVRPNYAAIAKFGSGALTCCCLTATLIALVLTPSEASVGAALRHIIRMQLVASFCCVVLKPHSPLAAGVRCLCCGKRKVVVMVAL